MNSDANKSNDPLRKLPQDWKVSQPLPPRFQEAVWQRIRASETVRTETFWSLLQGCWLAQTLPGRAIAAGILGCPVKGVETRMYRARQRLRVALNI